MDENWSFVNELREPRLKKINWRRKARRGEIDLGGGIRFRQEFPDPERLLDSAAGDFQQLLEAGDYPVICRRGKTGCAEAYRIDVNFERCIIEAADTEGIRRALYYLEDELTIGEGPFLKPQKIERKPFIKSRISRCFFGPLKRPPYFRDELLDDIDYYPAGYLSRLAHEGVNGLWLTIDFKSLVKTGILPLGNHIEARLDKLRRTVESCRRYGIRIYLFCTEPISFDEDDPVLKRYPELAGSKIAGKYGFCPNSDTARRYLEEAAYSIFAAVPKLGGMIVLSAGEWFTLCCNAGREAVSPCPRCGDLPPHRVLGMSLRALEKGMHRANPDAELVSWPYTQVFCWGYDASVLASSHVPDGVVLMHNFESFGSKKQLGRTRKISDYWLSYIGPSPFFEECANRARRAGTPMFAKLQVGCSHECATTQYIPVPLNLYRKYRRMRRLGVSGVMQCWYFGAYPSLMTEAAGQLAFEPFPAGAEKFLHRLAAVHWGGKHASTVVRAWKCFSRAYDNYPLANEMGYIGPMHDGIVWKLFLKPVNRRLTPSWLRDFPEPGDRIHECFSQALGTGGSFTLEEIVTLTSRLARRWEEGMRIVRPLRRFAASSPERRRELGVAEAAGLLFSSAAGIFRFYQLREKMIYGAGPGRLKLLAEMERIVRDQIAYSRRMLALAEKDSTLGFHSEAEGYKFTPEMLRERIAWLRRALKTDFREVEACIRAGCPLFPGYTGEKPEGPAARYNAGEPVPMRQYGYYLLTFEGAYPNMDFVPVRNQTPPAAAFRADCDGRTLTFTLYADEFPPGDRFLIRLETERLKWAEEITVRRDGAVHWQFREERLKAEVETAGTGWRARLELPLDLLGIRPKPLRVNIERTFEKDGREMTTAWVMPHPLRYIFVLGYYNPDDYGWLL